MTPAGAFVRSWPPLAAVGAGLIQIALAAGLVLGAGAAPPLFVGILTVLLIAAGAAHLGWAALTLSLGRVSAPGAGLALALGSMVALVATLVVDAGGTSIAAVAAGTVLLMVTGVACADRRRRGRRTPSAASARSRRTPAAGAIGLVVGATLVSALVTPALGATEAGQRAPDHGSHGIVVEHEH